MLSLTMEMMDDDDEDDDDDPPIRLSAGDCGDTHHNGIIYKMIVQLGY